MTVMMMMMKKKTIVSFAKKRFFSHRKGSKGNTSNQPPKDVVVSRARPADQMAQSYPDRFLSCVFYAVLYPKKLLHSLTRYGFFFYNI